jgi:hypothetical protein
MASTPYAAGGYQITPHSGEVSPFAQCASLVEQLVVHEEPAAERDEQAAYLQADEEWASAVEWRLHAPLQYPKASSIQLADSTAAQGDTEPRSMSDAVSNSLATPRVFLLRFGSAPCGGDSWLSFIDLVMDSPQFKPCRDNLEMAGFPTRTPQGIPLLITVEQYQDTRKALVGKEVSPKFNLIIAQDLEYLLHELLQNMSFQRRPKLKQGTTGRQSLFDTVMELKLERTFLCYAPLPRNAESVVQSTTEVVAESNAHYSYSRGGNPRRAGQQYA